MRTVVAMIGVLLALPCLAQTDAPEPRSAIPTKGLLWGSKMTIEDGACCSQGAKPADRNEAAAFTAAAGRVAREGTILRLKLQQNRILKITDCRDQNACEADRFRAHRLAAWWPALGYYVVHVGLYEDSMAYLVSERDGQATRVTAPPVLSPSSRRAIALQSNLMSGVELNFIDLTTTPPTVVEIDDMPACAGAGPNSFLRPKPVWVDEARVRFEGVSPQPGDNPNTKQLLRIGAGTFEWEC